MRAGILLVFAVIIFFSGNSQVLTITSQAIDAQTREPLPFASVGILGKPIGTISNLNGEFDFHFPEEL